jgi:hypothetical protein
MDQDQTEIQPFRRGIALVRNFDTGKMLRWLTVRDFKKRQCRFISAERLEGESFREAVKREVAWLLNVDRKTDFLTSKMAQINLEFVDALVDDDGTRHYHVAFYNVEVYRNKVLEKIAKREDLAWLTSEEICDGRTQDGWNVDPVQWALVKRSDVIQHWESADSQHENP